MSIDLFTQKVQLTTPINHYPKVYFDLQSSDMSNRHCEQSSKNILTNKVRMVLDGHSPIESPTSDESETPPVDRWSRDFKSLMEDMEGVNVFRQFMKESELDGMFDFWFACKGLKENKEQIDKIRLINVIFKRFIIRSNVISLSEKCRQSLIDLYGKSKQDQSLLNETTFDEAASEVEDQLSGSIYQNFLLSEIFLKYFNFSKENNVQKEENIKNDEGNYVQSVMPTIDEVNEDVETSQSECTDTIETTEEKLVNKLSKLSTNIPPSDRSKKPYLPSQYKKPSYNPFMVESYYKAISQDPPPHPYHVRYSTIVQNSKRDSEIQSISSHSTSDSFSCVSGGSREKNTSHGHHIRQQRSMINNAVLFPLQQLQRPKQQTNSIDPTQDVDKFAKILIEKLSKVRQQQEADLRLEQAIKECNRASPALPQRESGVGQHAVNKITQKSGLGQALKDAWKKIDFSSITDSENDQAILDKHFAQVFNETPNSGTPTTSLINDSNRYHYSIESTNVAALPPPSPLSPTHSIFSSSIPVTVKFSNEDCPYKLTLSGPVTLLSFKQQIPSKKGQHQYYFKRKCSEKERNEFNSSYVHEKISNDDSILPQCEGKIFAIVELS